MQTFANLKGKVFGFAKKHEMAITTVIELAGFAATVYLACTEKTKADRLLEAKAQEKQEEYGENVPLTFKEKSLVYIKTMWPSAVAGLSTSFGIGWSNRKHGAAIKDAGLLAMAYKDARDNYKQAVEKQLNTKQLEEVNHQLAIDSAERSDLHVKGIIDTGDGHELFYDQVSGYWFYSSNQKVSRAALDFANGISQRNGGYYGDFLEMLNLPCSGKLMSNTVFIRDSDNAYNIPTMRLEYGSCNENLHELTGEKYAVITWVGNQPDYVDTDVLYSLDY